LPGHPFNTYGRAGVRTGPFCVDREVGIRWIKQLCDRAPARRWPIL
jgi:hypothetical protein